MTLRHHPAGQPARTKISHLVMLALLVGASGQGVAAPNLLGNNSFFNGYGTVGDPTAFSNIPWKYTSSTSFEWSPTGEGPTSVSKESRDACLTYTLEKKGQNGIAWMAKPNNLIYLPNVKPLVSNGKYRFSFIRQGTGGSLIASVTATERFDSAGVYHPMVYADVHVVEPAVRAREVIEFVTPIGYSPSDPKMVLSSQPTEVTFQAVARNASAVGRKVCVTDVRLEYLGQANDILSKAPKIRYNQVVMAAEKSGNSLVTVVNPPLPSTIEVLQDGASDVTVVSSAQITSTRDEEHTGFQTYQLPIKLKGKYRLRLKDASGATLDETPVVTFDSDAANPYRAYAPNLHRDALHFFYAQRAGQPIFDRRYATTSYRNWLDRPAGHEEETASCFSDKDNFGNDFSGACTAPGQNEYRRNVAGGWYDAGDHGKYVVNGATALWALQNVAEFHLRNGSLGGSYPPGFLKYGNISSRSDLMAEARYEMDWLLSMQIRPEEALAVKVPLAPPEKLPIDLNAPSHGFDQGFNGSWGARVADDDIDPMYGLIPSTAEFANAPRSRVYALTRYKINFPLTTITDPQGLVFSAVRDKEWTPIPTSPDKDDKPRVLDYPTTHATLAFAAVAAQASRLWRISDSEYSKKCLDAANRAYAAAKKYSSIYRYGEYSDGASSVVPAINVGGGAYADTNVIDAFHWAAAEIYLATSTSSVAADSPEAKSKLVDVQAYGGLAFVVYDYAESFSWKYNRNMGLMSILVSGRYEDIGRKMKEAIPDYAVPANALLTSFSTTLAGYLTAIRKSSDFGVPHTTQKIFNWASNADIANAGGMLALGSKFKHVLDPSLDYLSGARRTMSYLLGNNPLGKSYVTGYGSNPARNPHHRFWAKQANIDFPSAPPGMLVGGPNGKYDGTVLGAKYLGNGKFGFEVPKYRQSAIEALYLNSTMSYCNPRDVSKWPRGAAGNFGGIACYSDDIGSYMTNEVAINWNSAFFWLSAYLD